MTPGFVAELPRSSIERGTAVPHIEHTRVPLTVVPPPGMGAGGLLVCRLVLLLACCDRYARASSSDLSRHDDLGDGPDEAEHLAGDGGGGE